MIGVCCACRAAHLPFESHDCVAANVKNNTEKIVKNSLSFQRIKRAADLSFESHDRVAETDKKKQVVKYFKHRKFVKNSLSFQRIKRFLGPRTKSLRLALQIARLRRCNRGGKRENNNMGKSFNNNRKEKTRSPSNASNDHEDPEKNLTETSIFDQYSGSTKITTHLDHISDCKATPQTYWSNRWTNRISIINTHRNEIAATRPSNCTIASLKPPGKIIKTTEKHRQRIASQRHIRKKSSEELSQNEKEKKNSRVFFGSLDHQQKSSKDIAVPPAHEMVAETKTESEIVQNFLCPASL